MVACKVHCTGGDSVIHRPTGPVTPGDILLLSGLPGAGKTHYASWLQSTGWGRVDHDRLDQTNSLDEAWIEVLRGADSRLLRLAGQLPGVVIEWGFDPLSDISRLTSILDRGYNGWYFDGDADAALDGWRRAWNGALPEFLWTTQTQKAQRDVCSNPNPVSGTHDSDR